MDELEAHRRSQEAFAAVIANVKSDQLDDPTPCAEWQVRDLLEHVIGGQHRVSGTEAAGLSETDDLAATWAAAAAGARAAFEAPDGLTRNYEIPRLGEVPGSMYIGLRTTDNLTHAWDLAKATGQTTDLDPELSEAMLAVSRQRIQPAFRGEGGPFGAEQPCDESRPATDRLAAFLGRVV